MRPMAIWLALLLWSATGMGAPVDDLEAFLARITTLSAAFDQVVVDERGRETQRSAGRFYLKRPGRFRWEYQTPYRQLVVADGDRVWFYDPDLAQVTVRSLNQALGSAPALLLSGRIRLAQRFRVSRQGREGDHAWVELTPRREEDVFRRLRVEMVQGILKRMELADNFGQLTRIRFHDLAVNPVLADDLFRFHPPEGVDVFEG